MRVKVWIVNTCVPGEPEPCLPAVFGTLAEAEAYADEMLRAEWDSAGPENDECTERAPYPGDWREAHERMVEYHAGEWGQWELTGPHEIEIPSPL